jgi:hypothetical protein
MFLADFIDIRPSKGTYTWANKRIGPRHIATRLNIFFIQISYIDASKLVSSKILP